ncbi:MAG: cutinase family protein [Marmoricola sp.]
MKTVKLSLGWPEKSAATARIALAVVLAIVISILGMVFTVSPPAVAGVTNVLILGSTVTGGASSPEAREVSAKGYTPVVVSDADWSAMTASQFASYKAIVIGDPSCSTTVPAAAAGNASVWGPAVGGNTIIIGTDPSFHGKTQLINQGIDFVLDPGSKGVGAYLDLSCNYASQSTPTAASMLDGLRGPGAFQTEEAPNCYNIAHIVATHPALDGLSDGYMSGWGCSVHEVFDSWPGDFQVLAIAKDLGSSFTASDGTVGSPYILASGSGLHSFPLSLSPLAQTVPSGNSVTVTAQLLDAATSNPVSGKTLSFRVSSGPNAGDTSGSCVPASCTTNTKGEVGFSYIGFKTGVDTVQAWIDTNGDKTPSVGEPQTTASVTFAEPTYNCTDYIYVAALGSGQTFKSTTDLSVSPQLNAVYTRLSADVKAAGKTISPFVFNYPSTSVNVLFDGLGAIPVNKSYITNLKAKINDNLSGYLGGKNQGVNDLFGTVLDINSKCQDKTMIILAGYSQGSMVVHEFLNNFGGPSASRITGSLLVADPERVPYAFAPNLSSADPGGSGVCTVLKPYFSCASPFPSADARFKGTLQLCTSLDGVCDTSTVITALKAYVEAWASCFPTSASCHKTWQDAIKRELAVAASTHTPTTYIGTNKAADALARRALSTAPLAK